MPKNKSRRMADLEAEANEFAYGAAEAATEDLLVQQFRAIWSPMNVAAKADAELVIAACGLVGQGLVNMAEALASLKKGKAPTLDLGGRKTGLSRAACNFAKSGTYKKKSKKKAAKKK